MKYLFAVLLAAFNKARIYRVYNSLDRIRFAPQTETGPALFAEVLFNFGFKKET